MRIITAALALDDSQAASIMERLSARFTPSELVSLEAIPFGQPCAGCDEILVTERDFYEHFLPTTSWSRQLGDCPVTVEKRRGEFRAAWDAMQRPKPCCSLLVI